MVSVPSGLLTCFVSLSAARTLSIRLLSILFACVLLAPGPAASGAATTRTILVLGDSLSAGYGIRVDQGWVALLQARLRSKGYGHLVVNASASGETTGGALARLPRALERHRPAVVIVELGGNDGLRGLPLADVRRNFEAIIAQSLGSGARVLLVGMLIPPNYGPAYSKGFGDLYTELALENRLPLVPFILEGVALDDSLMQEDGFHPTAAAQPKILDLVWPKLEPLLPPVRAAQGLE